MELCVYFRDNMLCQSQSTLWCTYMNRACKRTRDLHWLHKDCSKQRCGGGQPTSIPFPPPFPGGLGAELTPGRRTGGEDLGGGHYYRKAALLHCSIQVLPATLRSHASDLCGNAFSDITRYYSNNQLLALYPLLELRVQSSITIWQAIAFAAQMNSFTVYFHCHFLDGSSLLKAFWYCNHCLC